MNSFKIYKGIKLNIMIIFDTQSYDHIQLIVYKYSIPGQLEAVILTFTLYQPIREGEADSFYCNSQSSMLAK